MRTLLLGTLLVAATGDRIGEIRWMSSTEAFQKAKDSSPARWVLIYKEWPR